MSGWTFERDELLRKLWADGLSGSQIATRLGGVTRNAVIGKVHRLGLPARAARKNRIYTPRRRAVSSLFRPTRTQLPQKRATAPRPTKSVARKESLAIMASLPEIPAALRVDLLDLRDHMCRWPIGDPKDESFHFCGRYKNGGPYCGPHSNVAFQVRVR